jgi:GTP:adenosylcobinamide-phosphate guanylyltransferase
MGPKSSPIRPAGPASGAEPKRPFDAGRSGVYGLRPTRRFFASCGAVAQLGERRVRNAEVGGSIPLGSTIFFHAGRRPSLRPRVGSPISCTPANGWFGLKKNLDRGDLSKFLLRADPVAVLSDDVGPAYLPTVSIPAIVTAGDGPASKAVCGDNKVYLEVGGQPLVARVVSVLQHVPEISEVWVVGNAERLDAIFSDPEFRAQVHKPLHVVQQFRNLYENAWKTFRLLLPAAGPDGRDPKGDEVDRSVLYLSSDLPFATPQEISEFVRRSTELVCDYAMGIVPEESMQDFSPAADGTPGIEVAYFNTREGRMRQSNLHYAKPARILNRYYVEDMYEHRYQKEFGHILRLAWTIVRSEQGGLRALFLYICIHLAGVAHRRGFSTLSNWLRQLVSLGAIERALGSLLRADFRFVTREVGGCGVDIDNDSEYAVACQRFDEWSTAQSEKAESLYGALVLPPGEDA